MLHFFKRSDKELQQKFTKRLTEIEQRHPQWSAGPTGGKRDLSAYVVIKKLGPGYAMEFISVHSLPPEIIEACEIAFDEVFG